LGISLISYICRDRHDSSQIPKRGHVLPEEVMFERTVVPQSPRRRCCVERHIEQEFQAISGTWRMLARASQVVQNRAESGRRDPFQTPWRPDSIADETEELAEVSYFQKAGDVYCDVG
jgi:hypothetical protein